MRGHSLHTSVSELLQVSCLSFVEELRRTETQYLKCCLIFQSAYSVPELEDSQGRCIPSRNPTVQVKVAAMISS